ncbi:MAG: 50S ribosomal protein L24 [Bacteroidetes bacterium]|nr:50S ribosomal protein L24 [Bacteroidota bacterium]
MKIKKGDIVKVVAGADKGTEGRVLAVQAAKNTAIVEGVRIISRHTKPNAENPDGGIIKKEAPVHVSNLVLMLGGTATRVGRREENGKVVRYSKKTQEIID